MSPGLQLGGLGLRDQAAHGSVEMLNSPGLTLQDRRRPWDGPHMTVLWRARNSVMKLEPLPPLPSKTSRREKSWKAKYPRFTRLVAKLGATARWLCEPIAGGGQEERKEVAPAPPPRKWYRVHPTAEIRYIVRPDAGMRGKVPGAKFGFSEEPGTRLIKSQRWRRSWSVPDFVEREMGVDAPPGFEMDAFRNCCRICYEAPVEVVVLPCRHGALCELCLRKHFFSRPRHRGGRNCPFCRTYIQEVVRICREAVVPMYGYAIHVL
mmetsp:Transcript_52536/g.125490  ORF Transcript_52536/g.125490 Transcript_52536/m.125490 type:complete len:264 (-) Transcript_52536:139-930(-)